MPFSFVTRTPRRFPTNRQPTQATPRIAHRSEKTFTHIREYHTSDATYYPLGRHTERQMPRHALLARPEPQLLIERKFDPTETRYFSTNPLKAISFEHELQIIAGCQLEEGQRPDINLLISVIDKIGPAQTALLLLGSSNPTRGHLGHLAKQYHARQADRLYSQKTETVHNTKHVFTQKHDILLNEHIMALAEITGFSPRVFEDALRENTISDYLNLANDKPQTSPELLRLIKQSLSLLLTRRKTRLTSQDPASQDKAINTLLPYFTACHKIQGRYLDLIAQIQSLLTTGYQIDSIPQRLDYAGTDFKLTYDQAYLFAKRVAKEYQAQIAAFHEANPESQLTFETMEDVERIINILKTPESEENNSPVRMTMS